ncbi:hypothetical protein IWX47DRAFT_628047 [Phyllosticta citricarpa]
MAPLIFHRAAVLLSRPPAQPERQTRSRRRRSRLHPPTTCQTPKSRHLPRSLNVFLNLFPRLPFRLTSSPPPSRLISSPPLSQFTSSSPLSIFFVFPSSPISICSILAVTELLHSPILAAFRPRLLRSAPASPLSISSNLAATDLLHSRRHRSSPSSFPRRLQPSMPPIFAVFSPRRLQAPPPSWLATFDSFHPRRLRSAPASPLSICPNLAATDVL